jgi:integrase
VPTGRITKRSIDALTAGSKELFLWDDDLKGFGIRITPSGYRSYVLQYRMGGRESPSKRYTIGRHGSPWTPDLARKEAERLLYLVHVGKDPVEVDRDRRREAVDLAFDAYVEKFIELYLQRRWKQWRLGAGVLRREAVPALKSKPLPRIKRSDCAPIFDRLHAKPAVARITFATLRKLFRWAVSRGDLDRSPLEGADAPPAVPSRDRVLSDAELSSLWRGIETLQEPFNAFYKLLILTGQRREEVAGMQWAELNWPDRIWTLPGTRTKNGKPQLVPLSDSAVEILDRVAAANHRPSSGLVFSTTGKTPVSGFAKPKRRLDEFMAREMVNIAPWRVHDIRRTVATGLQRLGVRFEVTEAVLNHVSGARGGIAGVYQRYDWAAEKRSALESWAQHVIQVSREKPQVDHDA